MRMCEVPNKCCWFLEHKTFDRNAFQMEAALEECEHLYFEPKYLSDVLLKYRDTYYHMHRAVLAGHSKYFHRLFESLPTEEAAKEIEIPLLTSNIFFENEIESPAMRAFLSFFYFANEATLTGNDECVLPWADYLAFYFECPELELQIQKWTISWMKAHEQDIVLPCYLNTLHESDTFHWKELREFAIDMLARNLGKFLGQIKEHRFIEEYDKVSAETKSLVLRRAIIQH